MIEAADLHEDHMLFSTGVECSYPTITGRDGRKRRVDQLAACFHYQRYREDLNLVRALGIRYLRYGPPYYLVHRGPDRYDWEFTDRALASIRELGLVPIVDLCHFGVPDWIGDFQNPDFPELFAAYAEAFAGRFPWVRFYTPINEIYVCAKLSALLGLWNEQATQERAFVTCTKHLCRANLLAIAAIAALRRDAVFIQSESAEHYHLAGSDADSVRRSNWENERRYLSFDLLYSVAPCSEVISYLLDNGMSPEEYAWFMGHGLAERVIMGNDFYERNEQLVSAGGAMKSAGEIFGWANITRGYYERYRRLVMHTETNTLDARAAPRWLWKEFFNVRQLRAEGVPVIGFTWYSLLDQVDWDSGLQTDFGVVNPVGLFDLQRNPRPVAAAYRELIQQFGDEPIVPRRSESLRSNRAHG
jgi:beta-glucosidase/6-phospho-beta-glucosidase/beta-galactosidase